MMKFARWVGVGVAVLMSSTAIAAPCSTGTTVTSNKDASKASTVDPSTTGKTSPGAKAESPGTVGAMNNAGAGGSTATSPGDV